MGDTSELPPSLVKLSTTGLLRHERSDTIDQWIDASVSAGLIALSNDRYRTLRLTAQGREVMTGRVSSPLIAVPVRFRSRSFQRRIGDYRAAGRPRRRFF
jgi:superfamily II DNA helicase RecQ